MTSDKRVSDLFADVAPGVGKVYLGGGGYAEGIGGADGRIVYYPGGYRVFGDLREDLETAGAQRGGSRKRRQRQNQNQNQNQKPIASSRKKALKARRMRRTRRQRR